MHLQFNTPPSTSPEPPSWTQILLAGCKPLSLSSCGVPHLHPVLVKTYFQAALSPQQLRIGNPDMQFCQTCHNYATQRPLSTLAELKAIFEALTTIERVPWEQSQPVVILRLNRSCTRPLENTPPSTHILNIPCKDYNAWAQRTSTPGHRQVDGCRHICLLWYIYTSTTSIFSWKSSPLTSTFSAPHVHLSHSVDVTSLVGSSTSRRWRY